MGIGAGLYMYDVVVKSSRSLSHLLRSSCSSCDRQLWPMTFAVELVLDSLKFNQLARYLGQILFGLKAVMGIS